MNRTEERRAKKRIADRKYRDKNTEMIKRKGIIYRDKNRDKLRASWRRVNDERRFNGKKEKILKRDGYQCVKCNISEKEHIINTGMPLLVHHIDGNGKNAKIKNNNLNNLQTLCFSCHTKVHMKQTERCTLCSGGLKGDKSTTFKMCCKCRRSMIGKDLIKLKYLITAK